MKPSSVTPGQSVRDMKPLERLLSFSDPLFSSLSHEDQPHEENGAFYPKFSTGEQLSEQAQFYMFCVHVTAAGYVLDCRRFVARHRQQNVYVYVASSRCPEFLLCHCCEWSE